MNNSKHREKGKPGLRVKRKRGDQPKFAYQVPPEVLAAGLPQGTTVKMISLSHEDIYALAQRVEPEVTRWLVEKPAKNPLEALLLLVQAIYAQLQPPELPIPHKEMVELAQTLAQGYPFADFWPFTPVQMIASITPNHPDMRPNIPDEHILYIAGEVEKRLLVQLAEEGITLRDATQSGMLLVTMTHKILFEESSVFGADQHEMSHIARVLVISHSLHPKWPFRDTVKKALADCYHFSI